MTTLHLRPCLLTLCATVAILLGQPHITIELDRPNANYKVGEPATFTVGIWENHTRKTLLQDGKVKCSLTNDGRTPLKNQTMDLAKGNPFKISGTLTKPGFLRLLVRPQTGEKVWGAAFEPEKIQAAAAIPQDFWQFWTREAGLGQPLAHQPKLVKFPKPRKGFDAYEVIMPAPGGQVYGFLSIPHKAKTLPALVTVPGAGPGSVQPSYHPGFVTLNINVHNYNPLLKGTTSQQQYNQLNKNIIYMYHGMEKRETAYYHRAIVGISRAVRWLSQQPYVDAKRIGYYGSSQGGAFGFILGGLNQQFARLVCNVPALCDHLGDQLGRNPGWPQYCNHFDDMAYLSKVVPYFDAANFAARISAPVTVIVGLADVTCSPSSVYAAYQRIGSPKKIIQEIGMGHEIRPSYHQAIDDMKRFLQGK